MHLTGKVFLTEMMENIKDCSHKAPVSFPNTNLKPQAGFDFFLPTFSGKSCFKSFSNFYNKMLDCEAAYSQLGLTMHWSAEAQCIKVADKVLTQLLDVVLLPGDVQQEQVRLGVLGEYLLLYPGELLGVLHDLL